MAFDLHSTIIESSAKPLPIAASQRLELEQAIEEAIGLLDQLDGDADFEDADVDEDADRDHDSIEVFGEGPDYREDALYYGIDQTKPAPIARRLRAFQKPSDGEAVAW